MFILHRKLTEDTVEVARLGLSAVLLMNDSRFPWLVLVPMRASVTELHQLCPEDRADLIEEIAAASRVIERLYRPDKINVGSLGNIVSQLHVHIIGRMKTDPAWPGPAWGSGQAAPYAPAAIEAEASSIRAALKEEFPF